MGKIAEVQEVPVEKLIPYVNNAKMHSDEQVTMIASSIREFGFLSPVLIDRDFNVIAGHGRIAAAKKLDLKEIPCVYVEGLTDAQRKAYILADNKLTELGGWDKALLTSELKELSEAGFDINLTGFNIDDIGVDDIDFSDVDVSVEDDEEAAKPKYDVKPGQVYKLGRHRLMCGDSTKEEDVNKLIGDETIDLFLTDPPYNVGLGYDETPEEAAKRHRRTDGKVVANDKWNDDDEFTKFLISAFSNADEHMKPGGVFYIWHAPGYLSLLFRNAVKSVGWEVRQTLGWVKNVFVFGRSDYHYRHEPCLYGWKEGAAHYFIEDRKQDSVFDAPLRIDSMSEDELKKELHRIYDFSTVLYEDRPMSSEEHPTMKPVNLFKRLIINSSKENENVLDLFGGSGTTIIACEQLKRNAFVMELDPEYASSIIERYEQVTGDKAELISPTEKRTNVRNKKVK